MRTRIQIVIILAVVCASYFNALSCGFVYDDTDQVLNNPWITNPAHIKDIFLKNAWGFVEFKSNYYRPVMHLVYMLCYHLFGFKAWGFHLVNIALHAGASVLVFLLVSRRGLIFPYPLLAGALFAAHPVHTEAVTWIAGVPDTSFTLFGLLSLYLYTLSKRERLLTDPYYVMSVAAFLVSLFCKEPALMLLGVILAYDYGFSEEKPRLLSSIGRLVPFLAAAGVYLAVRFYAVGGVAPRDWHGELSAYQVAINIPPLFAWYLLKLLFPANLSVFHDFHFVSSLLEPEALLSLTVLIAYASVCIYTFKRNRLVFLGMCMIALPLLPSLYIPALGRNVFAERYLNLPVAGLAVIAASVMSRARKGMPGTAVAVLLSAVMVVGLYGAGTIARNGVYKDDLSLWMDTVRKAPDAAVPHNNLGGVFSGMRGFDAEAIRQFRLATELDPKYDGAFNNLGAAYIRAGRSEEAIQAFQKCVIISPDNPTFRNNLGVALKKAKKYDRAAEELRAALRLDPTNAAIRRNLTEVEKRIINKP